MFALRLDRQSGRQRRRARGARSGSTCYVFIPDNLEPARWSARRSTGRRSIAIRGNYDDVNRLCTQIADKYGWGFANINLRAYYAEGAKTYGFEIAEQLGWTLPAARRLAGRRRHACCRASRKGFEELRTVGLVDGELPKIYAAQAAGCAPVVRALHAGHRSIPIR